MKYTTLLASSATLVAGFFIGQYFFSNQMEEKFDKQIDDKLSEMQFTGNDGSNAKNVKFHPNSNMIFTPTNEFESAAQKSLDAVVYITTKAGGGYGDWEEEKIIGSGSGVIIDNKGYIVTNNHVIEDADKIQVRLHDNRSFDGKLVARDPNTDLAVVKINATDIKAIKFSNSDNVQPGQWVLAVGNPYSLTSTVTAGIISAKARNIGILKKDYAIESFIQTDAAVNPGNSGGALVNLEGNLVGINTAIYTKSGAFSGYSFAIPSNLVKKVAWDLIKYKRVKRGILGVSVLEITDNIYKKYKLSTHMGVIISQLSGSNSPAKIAGLKVGDVITHINDYKIANVSELQEKVGLHSPGKTVKVTVKRGASTIIKNVLLKEKGGLEGVTEMSPDINRYYKDSDSQRKNRSNGRE